METDTNTTSLSNALNELKNIYPGLSRTFIFNQDNKILAKDQSTTEAEANRTQSAFNALMEKASPLGKVESITFRGGSGQINISCVDDLCLTTVASIGLDKKIIDNITKLMAFPMQKSMPDVDTFSQPSTEPAAAYMPTSTIEHSLPAPEKSFFPDISKSYLPDATVNQLTVENLRGVSGLLSNPDIARIDTVIIAQWNELYGNDNVQEINIENPATGKNLRCHFESVKESKLDGKNIIQLSEKILRVLQTKKGEQVAVKPITEPSNSDSKASTNSHDLPANEAPPLPKTDSSNNLSWSTQEVKFTQLIVDNISGAGSFLSNPDTVYVDTIIMGQWLERFGKEKIGEVIIEDIVAGKQLRCKLKPIKNEKYAGKSIVQIPEKIQQALSVKKGALIKVKPII